MVRSDDEPHREISADNRISILVVEDEILVRMMIAEAFREAGYTVVEAANAHEALQVLQHDGVDFRAVVSDIRMPGSMDGVELARLVRSKYPSIKIVLASAHNPSLDWAQHDGYYRKPYDAADVVRHIKALLG